MTTYDLTPGDTILHAKPMAHRRRASVLLATSCAAMLLLPLIGCEPVHTQTPAVTQKTDLKVTRTIFQAQADAASWVKHSLQPYHFFPGSAELNDLGRSELTLLADVFEDTAGPLVLRHGEESPELYQARCQAVRAFLAGLGVKADQVTISDGAPGGDGAASEDVRRSLDKMNAASAQPTAPEPPSNSAPTGAPK